MGKRPAYQWYPGDWKKDPAVGALTPEARSFWREAIDVLFESETRYSFTATLQGWSSLTRLPVPWIENFISENKVLSVCDVTLSHGFVTILSRRMEREAKERDNARDRKRKERSRANVHSESQKSHDAPSSSSSSSSSKKEDSSELSVPDAPLFDSDSIPYSLAEYLRNLILENDPKAKVPDLDSKRFQNWCLDIDRLIRIDKREPELIAAIIHWCQNHHGEKFSWSSNILSAGTLRKQFPKLYLQAKEAGVSLWFERGD